MSPDHQTWMEPGDRFVGGQLDCWKKSVRGELLYCIYIYMFSCFSFGFRKIRFGFESVDEGLI